ncbi:DUF3043 domain-containing protein [Corynebacterium aquatimens]|uniref:DUF3043 domain-containing protein n=1 Tax=Corynebacterium aquatimens TaxID=1190508 RepID=A0A931GTN7_9CORY|nr:DUF3043 domain-containing protein [Corynebacterium aquatimens]MBG6121995.1 hypothetical protein [Corynebacterium aquatimens]WJY65466.1 hypothetical protein CAQUA_03765 [Corynebacterium aquatimens]
MKLPWKKDETAASSASGSTKVELPETPKEEKKLPKGYTPPKGRPTPKRHDQEVKRGVVRDKNALSTPQAAQKRKELKASMSKEEWKQYKKDEREKRREYNRDIQAKMDAGDERYLLARDQGDVRRYVRDWVDSRRFLSNFVMPAAFVLLILMFFGSRNPMLANAVSIGSLVFIIAMFAEAFIIGRRANNAVRKKFPSTTETGFSLGMYAYSRATQPRNWRTPKPQVAIGATV